MIYHITDKHSWQKALVQGEYIHPSLAEEGFIHCSTADQVAGVLQRYFTGQLNLIKLHIDPTLLQSELKYELAPSVSQEFPHIYGPIQLNAVVHFEEITSMDAQLINASIQLLPINTPHGYELIDEVIKLIQSKNIPHQVTPFNTVVDCTYGEWTHLLHEINHLMNTKANHEWLLQVSLHAKATTDNPSELKLKHQS